MFSGRKNLCLLLMVRSTYKSENRANILLGKFVTAKYGTHGSIRVLLDVEEDTAIAPTPTPIPHIIDQLAPEDLNPWQTLVKLLRDHAKNLAENSPADIDPIALANDPFLRQPANLALISATETRLGITLPADLKSFYLITNGTGFSGLLTIPGLRTIQDITWESTAETGLDSLAEQVDIPGLEEITYQERQAVPIPNFQRVLIISDEDDESIVGLLDPAYTRQVSRTIHELRQIPWEEPEEPMWT